MASIRAVAVVISGHTRLFLAAVGLFVLSGGAEAQAPARQPPVAAGATVSLLDAPGRIEASRGGRSHALAGAGVGFLAGVGATAAFLYTGGSRSLCDRSRNQDAMAPRECLGLTAVGGLAGAGLGAVVGSRIRRGPRQEVSMGSVRLVLPSRPSGPLALGYAVAF